MPIDIVNTPEFREMCEIAEHTFYPHGVPNGAHPERAQFRIAVAALESLRRRGLFDGDPETTADALTAA